MNTLLTPINECFKIENRPDGIQRIYIDVPEGSVNIEKFNTCFKFLDSAEMPKIMKCLNELVFQSLSDPYFTLTDCQKRSLEDLSLFLIDQWIAESNARKN